MPLIYDVMTAGNVAGYFNASRENVDSTNGEKFFPAKKQLGLKLAFVKGAAGRPVVLRASAFDTKVTLRERMSVTLNEDEMPFFKEAMLVKEADRQQLNLLARTGNQDIIDTITKTIFDDATHLVNGARARLEAMRMQVLATGKIAVKTNGIAKDFDYNIPEENKGTASVAWTEATANPLGDIEKAVEALENLGGKAEVIIMNAKTFALAKNAKSTVKIIKPLAPNGATVTKSEFRNYLEDEYGLTVVIESGVFVDDDGETKKYFPDSQVTLAPNSALGSTVFGTTPEESDLLGSNVVGAQVEIVETGIAITTTKETDPVNVQTKVSMIALPSFEGLESVYMLSTGLPVL